MKKFTLAVLAASLMPLTAQSQTMSKANAQSCSLNLDMTSQRVAERWFTVNDGMMGGGSSGGSVYQDDHLVFSGEIVTQGGGFSSIRHKVEPGTLAGADVIMMSVKSDGRGYQLTIRTDQYHRGIDVAFQFDIPVGETSDWTEVRVPLDDYIASAHGRTLKDVPFEPGKVRQIGVLLADGQDGPFELHVKALRCEGDKAS